jgi:transcriptional regulator with XRE-family HTH domain
MSEQLGAMLVRLRQCKGYSQLRVAEGLCSASGVTTVTRHEVSRWERQERIPSAFWLRWLAEVLEVPMAELKLRRR